MRYTFVARALRYDVERAAKEFRMPSAVQLTMIAALALGFVAPLSSAHAATHDGNWSVLVVTEKGDCDRGYRYEVKVAGGLVRYSGEAAVGLNGTVAANGAVNVVISANGKGTASGTGRLTAKSGSGTWRGAGDGNQCAGRWEAERR